jgi:hypothetical protein
MLDANWTKIESEIAKSSERYFWQIRLLNGHHIPTRQLSQLALAAIENFHSAGNELPRTEMTAFVEAAEQWLVRNQGKLWKLAAEEET